MKAVDAVLMLSLCLAPACWYLSEKSSYTHQDSSVLLTATQGIPPGHVALVASGAHTFSPTGLYYLYTNLRLLTESQTPS